MSFFVLITLNLSAAIFLSNHGVDLLVCIHRGILNRFLNDLKRKVACLLILCLFDWLKCGTLVLTRVVLLLFLLLRLDEN